MDTKDLLNGLFGILLYILTFPLVYIILYAVLGGEDTNKIECITIILGTCLGTIFACLSFTKPLIK